MSAMYKVGDKVVIVKSRVPGMNSDGEMDKYLGTIMTIKAITDNSSYPYRMEEDRNDRCGCGWNWSDSMIDHEATANLNAPAEPTEPESVDPYGIDYYTDKAYQLFCDLDSEGTLFYDDCRYSKGGIRANVAEWYVNKKPLFELLRKHPLWNEEAKAVVYLNTEHRLPSFKDSQEAFNKLYETCAFENAHEPLESIQNAFTSVDEYNKVLDKSGIRQYSWISDISIDAIKVFKSLFERLFYQNPMNTMAADVADCINAIFPDIKATVGQKTSRVANKLFCKFGFDKTPSYNKLFAKLADSMNPFDVERISVLSCNFIDYLLMSNGNSWSSCHTIINNRGSNYGGCYKGGTLSYANDSESLIFYTLDKSFEGEDYCLEPKINRQVFFWDYPVLVQERLYPQCNDETEQGRELVKQYRNLVENIFSIALGTPNLWVKENRDKARICARDDTYMYHDWECFPHYIVHLKKEIEISESESEDVTDTSEQPIDRTYVIRSAKQIMVGGDSYCTCCGEKKISRDYCKNDYAEKTLLCANCCDDNSRQCADCGCCCDEDDMHYIDGEYYCDDCCTWCEYHGEYERGDMIYVENYGYVCEYAAIEHFYYCEDCERYYCEEEVYRVHDRHGDERDVCDNCISNYTLCDNCGEYYEETETIDGCHYCEDCAEEYRAEHGDDDDEEETA